MKKVLIKTSLAYDGISSVMMNYYLNINTDSLCIDFFAQNRNLRSDYMSIINQKNSRVILYSPGSKYIIKNLFLLFRTLKKGKYDVFHINGSSANILPELFIASLAGVKSRIAHSHNTNCRNKITHYLFKPFLHFFATTNLACSSKAGKWMFGKHNFTLLPNGIDFKRFEYDIKDRNDIRHKLNISNKKVLLHIGFFSEIKNQQFVVNLMPDLLKHNKDIVLIFIGIGELMENTKKLVRDLNLVDNIIFIGNTNEPEKYYSTADLFLLPSLYEGLPMVLIEAQCSSLNSIISDNISEEVIISDLVYRLSLEDREAWIEKIFFLLSLSRQNKKLENNIYNIIFSANYLESVYKT